VTPELRGRIKIAAFGRGVTVADMLRELLAREFPPTEGDPHDRHRGSPRERRRDAVSTSSRRPDPCRADVSSKRSNTGSGSAAARTDHRPPRRVVSFRPNTVFAFVRWAANDFGTIISRIDIVRAVEPGEPAPDAALRAPGRRHPAEDRGLAEGRACCAARRDRGDRHRCARRFAGSLAACPQPMAAGHARAYTLAASRLPPAPEVSHDARRLILVMALATMGVGYPALTPMPIKLIWNASASAPIGFYTIDFDGPFEVTDLVAVDAPEPLATFLAERGYLPKGVPLLKRVLGVSGQTVCRSNLAITSMASRWAMRCRDRAGRDLPSGRAAAASERRSLPHELAGPRQPGRSLLRPDVHRPDHRPRGPLWTDEDGTAASNGARRRDERLAIGGAAPADGFPNAAARKTSCLRLVNSRARTRASPASWRRSRSSAMLSSCRQNPPMPRTRRITAFTPATMAKPKPGRKSARAGNAPASARANTLPY
jgi:type IV secretory pathway protease TraF